MGPFFKFVLAESWGCPGMLRMPSGFKAWRLFAHGLQTLSRLQIISQYKITFISLKTIE